MLPKTQAAEFNYAPIPTPAYVASLIESAVRCLELDPAASRDHLLSAYTLVKRCVGSMASPAVPRHRSTLATWQAKRVLAYIDSNLNQELQTKELAALTNLSASHFFRAFKGSIGLPPKEYITRRRIDLARTMMSTTNTPLSQIALDCGWQDQSSFCRTFRRVLGQTPNVWRRAIAVDPTAHLPTTAKCAERQLSRPITNIRASLASSPLELI
jgi:AraC family transcriptional regulator